MAATQLFGATILVAVYLQASSACKVDFEKVGCYHDVTRPLPELIMTDRDPSDKERYSGVMFNWNDFEGSTRSLICRCAVKARSKGYRYIGIQYYAECWSGSNGTDFSRDGQADSCLQSYKTFGEVVCDFDSPTDCVGKEHTNFVYDLLDCWEIVDVGVLLDVSSSMQGQTLTVAKEFLNKLFNLLNISRYGAHAGLITFTHTAQLEFTFKSSLNKGDSDGLKNAINEISSSSGSTWPDTALKLADSILFTEEGGSRSDVPRFVITITDGSLHQDSVITPIMLSLQSSKNVHLMSVGVGTVLNEQDLVALALSQSQNVFNGNHDDAAQKVVDRIQAIAKDSCMEQMTITSKKGF